MPKSIIIATKDRYLSENLGRIVTECGHRSIRTASLERIKKELKKPNLVAIIDVNWEDVQAHGILRQLVNLARITDNKVLCICPNQEEELKKLAKSARPTAVFIRYDLEMSFREYIRQI
jgi:ribosome-binding ATPase YchF (GTP1/OBG family)